MVFKKKILESVPELPSHRCGWGPGHRAFGRPAAGSEAPHSGIPGNQRASPAESPDKGAREVKV